MSEWDELVETNVEARKALFEAHGGRMVRLLDVGISTDQTRGPASVLLHVTDGKSEIMLAAKINGLHVISGDPVPYKSKMERLAEEMDADPGAGIAELLSRADPDGARG